MIPFFISFVTCLSAFFRSRYNLALEILALRQQFSWMYSSENSLTLGCNDVHLRRLIRDYLSYYHADRIHDSLEKDTAAMRPVSSKPNQSARLVSLRRIGGLHHRYDWQKAA